MSLITIRYIYPGSAIWKTMGLGFNNPVTHLFLFLWALSMSWPLELAKNMRFRVGLPNPK
jgi:hypothetical protein